MQWPQPFNSSGVAAAAAAASSSSSQPQPPLTMAAHAHRMREQQQQQLAHKVQQMQQQIQQQKAARIAQQTAQQQARSIPSFSLSQPAAASSSSAAAASASSLQQLLRPTLNNQHEGSTSSIQVQAAAKPSATSSSSDHDGAAASSAFARADPAPAATRPSLTGSLRAMRRMLQGSAESVSAWLLTQLRPAMLHELSPQLSTADRAARRAHLLRRFEEEDGITLLMDAMHKCAKEAVAQLTILLQQPKATAMQPTTASHRAAAAASSSSVQVAADPSAGKGAAKAKLKANLTVLNVLVGSEGALRMLLLSDSGSAVDLPPQPLCWIFTLFAASILTFKMIRQLHETLHQLPPTTSKFQLEATFEPLHDLRCYAVACDAMQLLWAVMSRRQDQLQLNDMQEILKRMWEQAKVINAISTDDAAAAAQPRTRWSEHLHVLLPPAAQRLELQLHVAACLHALCGVRSSVGSLSSATNHAPSAAAALSGSSSQHSAEGAGSQAVDDSTPPSQDRTTAPAASASSSSLTTQRAANIKAKEELHLLMLHVIKSLAMAVQSAANDASVPLQRRQKLLLLVSEVSLKLASSLRLSQALLLATLSYLNEHLMPLLFGVIADPSAHLQLLQVGWRMVLKMIERVASTDAAEARAMAAEIKRSGAIHSILAHCQRITDASKEAELMYRDGLCPRDVVPTALELLAVLIARTAHTPSESAEPKEIEPALGQHIRRFSWERMCQDALSSIAAGSGAAACTHLTLLTHWLESYTASELFASNQAELSTHALASLLEQAITTMAERLDKPLLLRLSQLIIISEHRFEACLPERTCRSLFKACRSAQLQLQDCSDVVWTWLWDATFTEARDLQMDMLVSQLLETVADEDLPAHLEKTADWIAAAGPNGIRALTRFLENLGNQFASQDDQPYMRSFKQIGVRAVTVLYFLLPRDPLRASNPESALQVMLRMRLKDAFGLLLSKGWHRVGMRLDSASPSNALPSAEGDEMAERTLLQLHRQLVALCAAIVRQEKPADASCMLSGFQTAMQVIVSSVLEMFQSHLADAVADHELHLDIMQLLPTVLTYDERGTLLQLASARSIAILRGMTAHVPICRDLPSIDQMSLLFKATPGLVGAAPEDVEEVQALQTETQIHLLQLLARLIPAARRFNDDAESSNDLHTKVDARSFAHITNVQQIVFMLASPLLDLRGAAFALLSCFLTERLVEFDSSLDEDESEDDADGLAENGANGALSRPALHLSFIDARKIMLAVQNTLQQTMHHDKLNGLAETAINAMQLLVQSGPAEWSTPLVRLPWNGFLLRSELGHLSGSDARLSPVFFRFFALTSADAGWAAEIRQWIRAEPTLQALQRLLTDASASVEVLQHALHLLQALKSWSLLEDELVALAQSVLAMLRSCLERLSREKASATTELKTVADKIDALDRALAPPAPSHLQATGSQDVPMEASQTDAAAASAAAAATAASSSSAVGSDAIDQQSMEAAGAVVPLSSSPSPMDTSADEVPKPQPLPQPLNLSPAAAHSTMNGFSATASGSISPFSQDEHVELNALDSIDVSAVNGIDHDATAASKQNAQRQERNQRQADAESDRFEGDADGAASAKQQMRQQNNFSANPRTLLSYN